MKFLRIFGVSAVVALSAGTGLAYAQIETTSLNGTTGPNSRNLSELFANRDANVEIVNANRWLNDYEIDVQAGKNRTIENTVVGDQVTGDVNVDIRGNAGLWTNDFAYAGDVLDSLFPTNGLGSNGMVEFGNEITGPRSINRNHAHLDQDINLELRNSSRVTNEVDFRANTGRNITAENTLVGDVVSGGVNVTADFGNDAANGATAMPALNLNWGTSSIGSSDLRNYITGPNSENINEVVANSELDVYISNENIVKNQFQFDATTGFNTVAENTSVGDIVSGDVNISVGGF